MPGFLKAIREAAAAAPVNQDLVLQDGNCGMILSAPSGPWKQPRTILSRPQSRR